MKIGILSSGGDCPGINATIRGVGKTAIMHYGMEVIGIHSGFVGLLNKDVQTFDERSLSGILNLGGTILGTSREKPFRKLLASGESEKPQLIRQNYENSAWIASSVSAATDTENRRYALGDGFERDRCAEDYR